MSRALRFAATVVILSACSKPAPERTTATGTEPAPATAPVTEPSTKDPETARKMIAEGAIVLDVRTPEEFGEDHLQQASNLPIEELAQRIAEVDKLTGGDKTKPIVVHCAAGRRAGKAQQQLEAAGYTRVVNGGGLDDLR